MHSNAEDSRLYVGDKKWNNYFIFSTVRNPFARIVSWYNHPLKKQRKRLKYIISTRNDLAVKEKLNDDEKILLEKLYKKEIDANKTIKWIKDKNNFETQLNIYLENKGKKTRIDNYDICQCMVDWLNDGKGEKFIHTMKLENIKEDWGVVCKMIGILCKPIFHENVSEAGNTGYREYYNDKTKLIVENLYQKDLECFDYEF